MMCDGKREALEVALRRTLGFHLGEDETGQHEQLVFALLDAAADGGLRDGAAVAQEFVDYLPDATNTSSPSSSPDEGQEGQGGAELYEDILRLVSRRSNLMTYPLMCNTRPK